MRGISLDRLNHPDTDKIEGFETIHAGQLLISARLPDILTLPFPTSTDCISAHSSWLHSQAAEASFRIDDAINRSYTSFATFLSHVSSRIA